jgi:hypothetical protein
MQSTEQAWSLPTHLDQAVEAGHLCQHLMATKALGRVQLEQAEQQWPARPLLLLRCPPVWEEKFWAMELNAQALRMPDL